MLWCTSGIAEFWSLTLDEQKRLLETAIEEGRAADPDVVVQACTAAMSAKDCLELTRHAQQAGADIVYIQTPMMEAHGGKGVLKFFQYIADRTDIALGMFNSPSSGYVLTPAESARIYDEVPAVCATKEGAFRPASSRLLHELAPDLVIWECDTTVYRAGWLRAGIVGPAPLGRLSVRDPAAANTFRVLGPDLERPADGGDGLRGEVRA
jgi:4-hydroxy-tetrahydrodipicolinate synthase